MFLQFSIQASRSLHPYTLPSTRASKSSIGSSKFSHPLNKERESENTEDHRAPFKGKTFIDQTSPIPHVDKRVLENVI